MTIKVYISGICGSNEVRKHQQRVLFILQTLPIDLQIIDVTEPGRDEDLVFMQETAKKHEKKTQLPPQIFNDDVYCGDYADFELANDDDDIMKFLKLEKGPLKAEILQSGGTLSDTITQNGINHEDEKEVSENQETDQSNIIENSDENQKSAVPADENIPQSEETESKIPDSDETDKVAESETPQESSETKKEESEEEESEEESE